MKFIFFSFLFFSSSVYAELSESCKDIFYKKLNRYEMVTLDSGKYQPSSGVNKDESGDKIYYYFIKKSSKNNPLPSFYIKEKSDSIEMTLYQGKVLSSNNDIKTVISYNSGCSRVSSIRAYRGTTPMTLNEDVCHQYRKQIIAETNNCVEEDKIEGLYSFEFQKLGYGSLCNDYFPEVEPVIEAPDSSHTEPSSVIGL